LRFPASRHADSVPNQPRKRRSLPIRILRAILFVHLWYWGVIAFFCLLYNFMNPLITPLMVQRLVFRGYGLEKRVFLPIEQMPDRIPRMVVALEDGNYYKHFGFDLKATREAWERNKKAGKIRFGASTISNQVARSIFLTTHRNYLRKYLEVQATLIMETLMSKRRMLELYLNYVEWGRGIYGIETASLHYYGKSCARINREQSMRLVCILTNPVDFTPATYSRSASARQRYRMLQRYF